MLPRDEYNAVASEFPADVFKMRKKALDLAKELYGDDKTAGLAVAQEVEAILAKKGSAIFDMLVAVVGDQEDQVLRTLTLALTLAPTLTLTLTLTLTRRQPRHCAERALPRGRATRHRAARRRAGLTLTLTLTLTSLVCGRLQPRVCGRLQPVCVLASVPRFRRRHPRRHQVHSAGG